MIKKNYLLFPLLLISMFYENINAQRSWEPAGYGASGNFTGVCFDPTQAGVVYITSDVTGIFRSTDYGETWEVRCSGLGNYQVSSFAIDPFDSNTLYAGVGIYSGLSDRNGIYVSHDAGLTWQQFAGTVSDTIIFRQNRTVQSIAPDPYRQGVILSGSWYKGIWRSTDSGSSWTQVFAAPVVPPIQAEYIQTNAIDVSPFRAPVTVILFHPTDSNVVYAGLDGYGILKSTDAGITWDTINTGLPDTVWVKHLTISSDGNVLHAALAENGVYKSTDGGNTWQPITSALPTSIQDWVSAVAAHPTNTDTAYFTLATSSSPVIWKTTDGGVNWAPETVINDTMNCPTETWHSKIFPLGAHYAWHIAMDPFDSDRLIFVDLWSVFRSTDGGITWKEKVRGAQNTGVDKIFADINHPDGDPDTLWATHMDAGLLRSYDKGNTWQAVLPSSLNALSELDSLAGHYWDFAIALDRGVKYYYVGASPWNESKGRIFRSTNGINWETVFIIQRDIDLVSIQRKSPRAIAVDPSQQSIVYAAFDSDSIYKSTSNGDNGSWAPTVSQPGNISSRYYCSMALNDSGWVFVSSEYGGVWRSKDGGASWQTLITQQEDLLSYQVLIANGKLYATGYDKFGNPTQHYSTDWGDTWQEFNNLFPTNSIEHAGFAVAVDPSDSNHIVYILSDRAYDGANRLGVYESIDSGLTWDSMNAGLGNLNITTTTFGKNGTLYAGTSGNGIWTLPPAFPVSIDEDLFAPSSWHLQQNYPNPFNPLTSIVFEVPEYGDVSIKIFNLHGQEIRDLTNGTYNPGLHKVVWNSLDNNGRMVPSGIYLFRMKANHYISTKKSLLIR